ncbi:hypothetical protein RJ639_006000 [Escallonia herrerae]|uniref:Uncharacterized protein n=1 Tax=Escallonia herrerae TaxID=1293975 RepID=A0AA88VXU7_9ASTE|nr:hypothetical protein RJ639_006000 [Escallonia herrerae]
MMPSSSFATSSSASGSASATVRVEKATSEFLMGPDWTMNIDICDTINSNHWLAKDVVKAVKKRLQHKNPKVHMLALTLLETMVKNCGDYVHFQIAEKNVLQEMIKITDMHVRDKILVMLDSWQEAFGGAGGKHPQYYWAYEELRRSGVEFPKRSLDAAPIFTPPVTHPTLGHAQAGYGMPSNSSTRLDEAMASEIETLSSTSISSMRNVLDLLSDMLQAVNPSDSNAVKDEIIVDLIDRCRANQKKLMQMLSTTGDEELLGQGLELNDSLQSVLAKHDAIASGSPLPTQVTSLKPQSTEIHDSSLKPSEVKEPRAATSAPPSAPVVALARSQVEEEEEEEDDFAQLARRHSRMLSPSEGISNTTATPSLSNALALPDPPAPVRTTKEQDMIDFLSITLSTATHSPQAPSTPPVATQNMHQATASPSTQGYPYASQSSFGNQGNMPFNSYVVPWAQPQQPQPQPLPNPQPQPRQSQSQPQTQPQYPPPPWAATPGYYNNQSGLSRPPSTYSSPRADTSSYMQRPTPLQSLNSLPARGSTGSALNGDARVSTTPRGNSPGAGQKPFVPSYRLFEDLNVLGSADGRFKTSNTSSSLSGTSSHGMVGGRK